MSDISYNTVHKPVLLQASELKVVRIVSATHMPFRCADEINWNGEDLASSCCVGSVSEEDEDSVITKYGEVNSR